MRHRRFLLHDVALTDLADAWQIVFENDGEERADAVYARLEAFCRSLGEFGDIGTRHDERRPGLRSTGVPGLRTASVLFVVTNDQVTVIRVSYLGRNVWENLPT
jgi:toxin ParE1/3/4